MTLENSGCEEQPSQSARRPWFVIGAVADLMFTAKISAAAKQAGCAAKFAQQEDRLLAVLREVPDDTAPLLIVDLNHLPLEPVEFIARVRATPGTSGVPILGFLSHTQVDVKRAAEQAGCTLVLPRFVFSQNISEILRQQSCHLSSLQL
jgi:PleD family two-component response regulator